MPQLRVPKSELKKKKILQAASKDSACHNQGSQIYKHFYKQIGSEGVDRKESFFNNRFSKSVECNVFSLMSQVKERRRALI